MHTIILKSWKKCQRVAVGKQASLYCGSEAGGWGGETEGGGGMRWRGGRSTFWTAIKILLGGC